MENPNLIEFYGQECPHSIKMKEIVSKFEKKHKTILTKLEVWHNEENDKLLRSIPEFSKSKGVPFFFNKENNKFICGACKLEELEEWAE